MTTVGPVNRANPDKPAEPGRRRRPAVGPALRPAGTVRRTAEPAGRTVGPGRTARPSIRTVGPVGRISASAANATSRAIKARAVAEGNQRIQFLLALGQRKFGQVLPVKMEQVEYVGDDQFRPAALAERPLQSLKAAFAFGVENDG